MIESITEGTRQDRPDPGGIVRCGDAVAFRGYVERFGEAPTCFVGLHGEVLPTTAPPRCERPAVMEVYGLPLCEAHGEEAAAGALEEIAHDLDQELQRPMNDHVRALSPHIEAALRRGLADLTPSSVADYKRADARLLAAFPLDRSRTDGETLAYVKDPDAHGRGSHDPPFDSFQSARMLIHRHMRLAFEEGASWLVEALEEERESVAAQAAYALALERAAGLRPSHA